MPGLDDLHEAAKGLQGLRLEPRQQALYEELYDRDPELANLYEVALRSLGDDAGEKELFVAGHSLRLLMSDFPTAFALDSFGSLPQLSAKVDQLDNAYRAAEKGRCYGSQGWSGVIDDQLEQLLQCLREFFTWRNEPRNQNRAREMFKSSDPAGVPLPDEVYEESVKQWGRLRNYFSGVAHRQTTNYSKFHENLVSLESLALQSLMPRPTESFKVIDDLLRGENQDA